MTAVRNGAFYGWPYSYYGSHIDERVKPQRPDLVAKAIVPDYALGNHTASLSLTFYDATVFPHHYRDGAVVGQRGSWNRKPRTGYKVVFVPFTDGKPSGPPEDFLTGFLDSAERHRVAPLASLSLVTVLCSLPTMPVTQYGVSCRQKQTPLKSEAGVVMLSRSDPTGVGSYFENKLPNLRPMPSTACAAPFAIPLAPEATARGKPFMISAPTLCVREK